MLENSLNIAGFALHLKSLVQLHKTLNNHHIYTVVPTRFCLSQMLHIKEFRYVSNLSQNAFS